MTGSGGNESGGNVMYYISRSLMLLACLAAYTFGSLLVNFSVLVPLKPGDGYLEVTAEKYGSKDWFGVDMAHLDGSLFVENVVKGGLADRAGVRSGDTVELGSQNGHTIFTSDQFKKDGRKIMDEVKKYLEGKGEGSTISPAYPLAVRFNMHKVLVKKGEPYLPMAVVFLGKTCGSIVLLLFTAFTDMKSLGVILSARTILVCFLPSIGWALADVCEILANGKMSASLYGVLSQSRLVGTALVMRGVLGTKQTALQMSILTSLTFVILAYVQVPDFVTKDKVWNGFGKPVDPSAVVKADSGEFIGMMYAFAKIGLSIMMGVIGQKVLQDPTLRELPLMGLQGAIFGVQGLALAIITPLYMWSTGWQHGLFGGESVTFWHCSQEWTDEQCKSHSPVDVLAQGFDYRTFVLVVFYAYRETVINIVLKSFDALVKNLVNSAATVAIFFLSLVMPPTAPFNAAKCGLVMVVALQIQQYAAAPVPKKEENGKQVNVAAEPMSAATSFLESIRPMDDQPSDLRKSVSRSLLGEKHLPGTARGTELSSGV
jgi:hypothetical protein